MTDAVVVTIMIDPVVFLVFNVIVVVVIVDAVMSDVDFDELFLKVLTDPVFVIIYLNIIIVIVIVVLTTNSMDTSPVKYYQYIQYLPTLVFISVKQKAFAGVFVYDISVTCHVNQSAYSAQSFTKLF